MKRSEMATLVELKEASFSHDTGPEILHQVSLSVQEGARIAVLVNPHYSAYSAAHGPRQAVN